MWQSDLFNHQHQILVVQLVVSRTPDLRFRGSKPTLPCYFSHHFTSDLETFTKLSAISCNKVSLLYMLSKNSGVFFLLYCLKNQDFPLWQRNNHFQYLFFKLIISKWFVMKTFGDESFIYSNDICLHLLKYLHLRGTCKCHKYILPKWQYAAKYNDNSCLFF